MGDDIFDASVSRAILGMRISMGDAHASPAAYKSKHEAGRSSAIESETTQGVWG
ncbi:hypothetical protein BSU04_30410 [Caballeronia sordidicola]|uniref:Uncharacterized protein n=1 Tax=Caballeronia sordidicola TaxID=196367 RepID=A0A226WU93_CABSO|nr:hypothetical protein BSU04_30410 [Caballeronia sordidicola]